MSHPLVPVGIGVLVVGLLLMVILLPMSLRRVSFDEVAFKYDKVSRKLSRDMLSEGLHDIGPSGTLLRFETTKREARFRDLLALTRDGLEVSLTVSVNYRLLPDAERLLTILAMHHDQEGHDTYVNTLCGAIIRDTAVRFTARVFYLNRADFQAALQSAIIEKFSDSDVNAEVDFVQVVNIDLPRAIENSILATIEAQQDIQNALTQRAEAVQQAQIRVQLAEADAQITVLNALRDAAQIDQVTEQGVLVERNRMELRGFAFGNISQGLGKGGEFFVDSYLRSLLLQENSGKTVVGL